ncbi:cytochrome c oxidase subunit II [Silvibacterium acidisoli]|uniref:cytochrome c oxidase subunit II n=1 Tax=Acidobacteriaceae bacterium ZG23-2 TaxID=2883246 RepID=UPI00406D31EC
MPWAPFNGSLEGARIDRLLLYNLIAFAIVFALAQVWIIVVMLRRKPRGNGLPAALRWAMIAVFGVLYIWTGIAAQRLWANSQFAGPAPEAMQVEVTGAQFQWYFRYPGTDATFGAVRSQLVDAASGNPLGLDPADPASKDDVVSSLLVLPAGREVDLRLRSLDVIHGLFIPGMRLKENAVPGMILHVHFTPQTPGTYSILCSQVCGLGHARMQARLLVVPEKQFTEWLGVREHLRQAGLAGGVSRP